MWEPDVTRALATPGVIKLLSTAETQRLIIDVLIASRTVLQQDPEMVKTLLDTYFDVVRHYRENPDALANDVAAETKVPMAQVKPMLAGVAWVGLTDNFQVVARRRRRIPTAWSTSIRSTLRILDETGAFKATRCPTRTRTASSTASSSARPSRRPPPGRSAAPRRQPRRSTSTSRSSPTTSGRDCAKSAR